MLELDDKARLFLNLLQDELPLTERPYRALGEKAGLSEEEALGLIHALKTKRVLRQIAAIFDTASLGYHSSLVACQAPPERIDEVAARINAHPGVSHNYARKHAFNLWFTLAVPSASSLDTHIAALQRLSGAQSMRRLPTLRLFKIGMKLDMTAIAEEDGIPETAAIPAAGPGASEAGVYSEQRRAPRAAPPTPADIACIVALQEDMEVRPDPFTPIAARLGISPEALFDWCRAARATGQLRRVAGLLNHREAGFEANGMGVWQVPEARVDEVGRFFAAVPEVTHCYLRPAYPDWPYNIFTMAHGRRTVSCDELLAGLSRRIGITNYAVLYSHKEYKKIRLRYFTGEIEAWERRILDCLLRIADCGFNNRAAGAWPLNPQSAIRNPKFIAFAHEGDLHFVSARLLFIEQGIDDDDELVADGTQARCGAVERKLTRFGAGDGVRGPAFPVINVRDVHLFALADIELLH